MIEEKDNIDLLPIHLILRSKDYAKTETKNAPIFRCMGEPIAEPTIFG